MPARKRTFDESELSDAPQPPSLLTRIRNDWRLPNIAQYLQLFGQAVKADEDLDIEVLEEELLKQPPSDRLGELGLAMLKMISSHRGLTLEIFDEYTRRQYLAKAPERNPFGVEEQPAKFAEMDVFTRLSVLHQLSVWTFFNPDRMRERMPEKDSQQLEWRIPPAGWDSDDREYYVLDDSRLYRLTLKPLPPAPKQTKKKAPKKKKAPPKKPTRGSRSSKRQRLLNGDESDIEMGDAEEDTMADESAAAASWNEPDDNGLGGNRWELIAITLEEYRSFMETIRKTRDPNEKALYRYLEESSIPALERAAASRARKAAARERELAALEKMATAKRSSRISARQQAQKDAEEQEAAEKKKKADLIAAQKEVDRQAKMEEDRESRMMTREQRLKDREARRILHEEEIEKLSQEAAAEGQEGRISERARVANLKKKQEALEELKQEEQEDWYFDCSKCGVHGKNIDDGSHSMACEKCGTWQHSKCHGITEEQAESDDFHFVCSGCKRPKQIKLNIAKKEAESMSSPPMNGATKKPVAQKKKASPASQKQLHDSKTSQAPSSQGPPQAHWNHFPPPQQRHLPPPSSATYYPPAANGHQAVVGAQANGSDLARPPAAQGPPRLPSYQYPPSQHTAHQWQQSSNITTPQHDPFWNNFTRQRPPQTTPSHQGSPTFQNGSPAPSLSATQGNNIRFSPSANHSNVAGSHAYTPTSNRPSAAAYSPTKRTSSPVQPPAGPLSSPPQAKYPPPDAQGDILPSAASGISPTKQPQNGSSPLLPPVRVAIAQAPIPAPRFTQHPPPAMQPQISTSDRHSPTEQRILPPASSLTSLPPAPTLSPSHGEPNLAVPVKRN